MHGNSFDYFRCDPHVEFCHTRCKPTCLTTDVSSFRALSHQRVVKPGRRRRRLIGDDETAGNPSISASCGEVGIRRERFLASHADPALVVVFFPDGHELLLVLQKDVDQAGVEMLAALFQKIGEDLVPVCLLYTS